MSQKHPYLKILFPILILKAFVALLLILYSEIGLAPDEAQYWAWSQELDWGYYSKPPGIAWQIWLGTQVFGNTVLGVRFFSLVISFFLSLSLYFFGYFCGLSSRSSFYAALVVALSPIGILSSFAATTDGGFILFWVLFCAVFARALSTKESVNYPLLGSLIALGSLFKWPIYLLWVFVFAFSFFFPYLGKKRIALGLGLSFLGLLPSLIWNSQNEWCTFRHVWFTVFPRAKGSSQAVKPLLNGNPVEFFAAQVGILSPVYYVILLTALFYAWKKRKNLSPPLLFCTILTTSLLFFFHGLSFLNKMQANWAVYVYPTGIVLASWYATQERKIFEKWLKLGGVVSLTLSSLAISIPLLQKSRKLEPFAIPYKINPFRHNLGWEALSRELHLAGYDPKEHFLFGSTYQISNILHFYGEGQKKSYFFNLFESRKNQLSFWPGMSEEQKGNTGFFVMAENSPYFEEGKNYHIQLLQKRLSEYFHEVSLVSTPTLFYANGALAKGALIFKCTGYSGQEPLDPQRY